MLRTFVVTAMFALCVSACAGATQSSKAHKTVTGLVMPSRNAEHSALVKRMKTLLPPLSKKIPARIVVAKALGSTPKVNINGTLERGRQFELEGNLDAAADSYDVALDAAIHSLGSVESSPQWISSLLARISIALARGEDKRKNHLLNRVLRYDPGLTLSASENRPSLANAIENVRGRIGNTPRIRAQDLGSLCIEQGSILIVARILASQKTEYSRFENCVHQLSFIASDGASGPNLVSRLLDQSSDSGQPVSQESKGSKRKLLWTAAGVATLGALVGIYFLTTSEGGTDVVPHW